MGNFLQYWKLKQLKVNVNQPLDYAASKQYGNRGVMKGDVLWIITLNNGRLVLVGRLRVAEVVDTLTAERLLGRKNLYVAPYYALPSPGTVMTTSDIDIHHFARDLRFESSKDRLVLKPDGGVDGKQLQSMRVLDAGSVSLLSSLLPVPTPGEGDEFDAIPSEVDELDFPEGALSFRRHAHRERSVTLIRQAKAKAKRQYGRLQCCACGFDFETTYGEVGRDYIECHHTLPVSELQPQARTRIEDIALLCSNCHRIVHRKRPWLLMHELQQLVLRG
jgi:hypothetical protein